MDEADWQRLLDELYQLGGYGEYPSEGPGDPDAAFDVAAAADMTATEVNEAAKPLSRGGLVEDYDVYLSEDRRVIRLNERGFKIAHERELVRQQDRTNRYIALFTVGLVVTGMLDVATSSLAAAGSPAEWLYAIAILEAVVLAALIGLLVLVQR